MAAGTPQDIMGNVFSGGAQTSFDGTIIILTLGVLFFLFLLGGLAGFLLWFLPYKHKVLIFESTSGGVRFKLDKGKIVTKKGVTKIQLFYSKATVQPPPNFESKYFYGKNEAFILHKENDAYRFHIQYMVNKKELKVLPQEVTDFLVSEISKIEERFGVKEFWEQYGGVILQIGFTVMVFGMMILLMKQFGELGGQMNNIASNLNSAVNNVYTGGGVPP